jgi:hypothetical protein
MSIPEIKVEITANVISWYAAIFSTIGIIFGILNYYRDRSKIKVTYKIGWRIINAVPPYKENTDYISIGVLNIGRRQITIEKAGYYALHGKSAIASESFLRGPIKLNEGESVEYLIEQKLVDLRDVAYFYGYDQIGRIFRTRYAPVLTILNAKTAELMNIYISNIKAYCKWLKNKLWQ